MERRKIQLAVISDTHLGTYGCHAQQLLEYLKSIDPEILVLNGDIIDIWNFNKKYFPKAHMHVIRFLLKMAEKGTKMYYLTGNHDEALRKYSGTTLGNILLDDKLILTLDGKKVWFFHGDIFDSTTQGWARILAKLGGKGYDLLILFNRFVNNVLQSIGKEKVSISQRVKSGVKKAVTYINNFETIAGQIAADQGFSTVVCGHIHQPQIRTMHFQEGDVLYVNSGDWIENNTALEYNQGDWSIYTHKAVATRKTDAEFEPLEASFIFQSTILERLPAYENSLFRSGNR